MSTKHRLHSARPSSPDVSAAMDIDESPDNFFERVKMLDQQRQQEQKQRRQRILKGDYLKKSLGMKSGPSIPHSESITNFNASISKEYRLNMDELVYESAYNYEKSRNKENKTPAHKKTAALSRATQTNNDFDDSGDDQEPEFSGSRSSQCYKKYEDLEIVRFDDFVSTRTQKSSAGARYSKFELSEDQKRELDKTLSTLIGGHLPEDHEDEEREYASQTRRPPRKTSLQASEPPSPIKRSPVKVNISKFVDESDRPENRPKPPVRPKSALITSNAFMQQERSSDTTQTKSITPTKKPQVRPKSTWLESTLKNSNSTSSPQATYTSPFQIKPKQNSWLDSAKKSSTSTPQGLETKANYTITKQPKPWLDSAKDRASSTPQGLATEPKFTVKPNKKEASWLDSANKRLSTDKPFELPQSKIAPIVPSKSNTLSKILEKSEMAKTQREKTLKELTNAKLNHVDASPSTPKAKLQDTKEPEFSPLILKKTRIPSPTRDLKKEVVEPPKELVEVKLKPAVPARKPSLEVPEALKRSQSLKPAVPTRKVSDKIPEALQKSQKLKPAVPARKVSDKVPEALAKANKLREAKPLPPKAEDVPEGLKRVNELKPALPKRKVSAKELEALQALNKLKKAENPEVKPKPRVVSGSKEVLSKKLQELKRVKEEKEKQSTPVDDKKAMLERVLQRAQTAPSPMLMAKEEDIVPVKKASTFDSATADKLTHPNKARAKGPKRRVPKSIQ